MTKKQKYEELEKLLKTQGWTILQEEMRKSILQAAYQLAERSDMPVEEMHFRRGAMWAAKKFLDLPEAVKALLNNDILMEAVQKGEIKTDERYGPQNM